MGEQTKFLEVLDRFAEIGEGVELAEDLLAQGAKARDDVAQFRVLIPLVGTVNAGKTTLVNAYLQRQHGSGLPTDIVPQTALATEIYAAPSADTERVELIGEDDAVLREVGLEEFGQIEKQTLTTGELEAQYAKAHLHHADLPDSNRKVLVDMPGLDSGLRTHNAAIQRYLPLGGYFFMVVDAEQGTLHQSEIEQLREFLAQDVDFTVLVNKIDKKPQPDADAIVSHIQEQVGQAFDKPASVCAVSAASDDVAAFRNTLAAVDFDDSLRRYWRAPVLALLDGAINSLHTRYSAFKVSTSESERVIEDLKSKEEALRDKLGEDERDIKNRYSARAVDNIVGAVHDAIRDSATSLADTYLQGGKDAGDREINEAVRHTLNRVVADEQADTTRRISEHYRTDIDEIDADYVRFVNAGSDGQTSDQNIGTVLFRAVTESASAIAQWRETNKPETNEPETNEPETNKKRDTTFITVTRVLAKTTKVIAPWLEATIVLLPLVRHLFQRQELVMRLRSSVASRVASELSPKIEADYARLAQNMLANLRRQVESTISRIRTDIHKSQAEIAAKKEDLQARKDALRTAIDGLTSLKSPLDKRP